MDKPRKPAQKKTSYLCPVCNTQATKGKHSCAPVGRPTKYKQEYCEKMVKYFMDALAIYKAVGFGRGGEKEYLDFPTFQGFAAIEVEVCHDTLIEWTKQHSEFSEAYKRCKAIQEQILVKGGLTRAYDSNFSKFILNSVSDTYKEKVVIDADDETKNIIKLAYALPPKSTEE